VVYLPVEADIGNTPYMVNSLEHRRPIVNGYSGNRPALYNIISETIRRFPSSDAFWTLHELDVRFIVSPQPIDATSWPVVERARLPGVKDAFLPDTIVYELQWSADADARFAAPPPPDPGAIPFAEGETAEYQISWTGAGSNLPAGLATLAAEEYEGPGEASGALAQTLVPRYRFVVSARTADWVARFFEARDRFETLADARLLPIVHTRQLREGRREVDMVVRYDHANLIARRSAGAGASQSETALRIPPGVRDSVTALYYARTLPLEPGSRARVPVNDAGRNLVLELNVVGEEEVEQGGRRVRALRLEPRLVRQEEGRAEVRLVVWLSTDARRVPLVMELSAAFGTVRAELVSYRGPGP
jgi:hypothetical protein